MCLIGTDKVSIQNVINTTRILVNPDIPEVETFKNSIAVHGIDTDSVVPLIGQSAKPPVDEEFLRTYPKRSLDDLVTLSDGGVYVVCAEVLRIVDGQDWWYPACKCHKSVIPDSGAYYCGSCDRHVFQVIPRFRVKLEVTAGRSTGVFVVFDSDMSYMMEKSCSYFVAQSKSSSQPIDVDSESGSSGSDHSDDSQATDFLEDVIVTPPMSHSSDSVAGDVQDALKRNLSKEFDRVADGAPVGRLKKIKVEKD